MQPFDIFISYKRKSLQIANNLYYRLTVKGYNAFFDLEEMRKDRFDKQIFQYIHDSKDVIVVLEEGSLDACKNSNYKNDWFCKELMFALKEKKNIIPMLIGGYEMPSEDELPNELKGLALINSLPFAGVTYFEEYINKLEEKDYLTSKPIFSNKGKSIFKFYSNRDCEIYNETGNIVGSITGNSDIAFFLPVNRKGAYRFNAIDKITKEKKKVNVTIDNDAELIVEIDFPLLSSKESVKEGNMPKIYDTIIGKDVPNIKSNDNEVRIVKLGDFMFNMIKIEGGELTLGATEEQAEADWSEKPPFKVNLDTFYMSEYPITQNLFELVMGYNNSHFKESERSVKSAIHEMLKQNKIAEQSMWNNTGECGLKETPQLDSLLIERMGSSADVIDSIYRSTPICHYPIETISLNEAKQFCKMLSKMTGHHFRLPLESEWEYAARGGQKSEGYKYSGSHNINEVAWYRANSEGHTHPVGMKKPNELGIYDMSGNVWEWTSSHPHTYSTTENEENESTLYIRRGGSWYHKSTNCRVSKRYASSMNKKTSGLGLRIVMIP